jgi:hypothetical protein
MPDSGYIYLNIGFLRHSGPHSPIHCYDHLAIAIKDTFTDLDRYNELRLVGLQCCQASRISMLSD